MKAFFKWIIRLIILVLLLVLVLNNMQKVDLNIFSIYHIQTPLIIVVLTVFIVGVLTGFLINLLRGFASKTSVKELEKEISRLSKLVKHDLNRDNK
jgi:putative membrane protein